jgi:hypothetical protein
LCFNLKCLDLSHSNAQTYVLTKVWTTLHFCMFHFLLPVGAKHAAALQ